MIRKIATIIALSFAVQACSAAGRIAQIGQTPALSPITNPAELAGTGPSQIPMPMEAPDRERTSNSLWSSNTSSYFGDPRASRVGDLLTVNINISDSAQLQNTTSRSRTSTEDSDLTQFFGLDLTGFFNDSITPSSLASLGSTSTTDGSGTVNRNESISLTVGVMVTQILPNGLLVLNGSQEVRVNNEVRELLLSGVIRPEDITSGNTIDHTKIAMARISYGGRGHISDMQRPRYGQELYDLLMPF